MSSEPCAPGCTDHDHSKKVRHQAGPNGRPLVFYQDIKQKKDKDGNEVEDSAEPGMGEFYQLLAVLSGGSCYYFRSKVACWMTIYLFVSSILNFRHEHAMQ